MPDPTDPFEPELTDELDLHTFAPREVKEVVRAYVDACTGRFREVRIVHGKGTSTLRRLVHAELERHPRVVSFALAPAGSGGWGATVASLVATKAMLFDLDGVLVRSEEVWFRVVEEAGMRFRGRAITREEFAPTFGQGTAADLDAFGLSCTAAELDAFYLQNFSRHAGETWVDPEARPLVEALKARGLPIAVVTNTMTPLAEEILRAAKLADLVDVVASADQVARAKPAPDVVLHALERLALPAGEAWMIGDSRFDREAAQAAGVRFIGYRQDGDRRIDTLPALLDLVTGG